MLDQIRMIMSSGSLLGHFVQVLPITSIVAIVYCVIRHRHLAQKEEKPLWANELIRLLFVCYLTGLINLVVIPANFWLYILDGVLYGWWGELGGLFGLGRFNLVPSLFRLATGELFIGSWDKKMLIANLLMFIPLGAFLPFVSKKHNDHNIWQFAIGIPLAVECLQIFLGRSFDIDDLICNFLGIITGFFITRFFEKKRTNEK